MPRLKTVEKDGARYLIAPLTVEQVEEFTGVGIESIGQSQAKARTYDVVRWGLENPNAVYSPPNWERTLAPEHAWPDARIRGVLDMVSIGWLSEEILALSGLEIQDVPKGEPAPQA